MAPSKKDSTIAALEAVHDALKSLSPEDRYRVLSSVNALLEIPTTGSTTAGANVQNTARQSTPTTHSSTTIRPVGITELIQQKKPGTHSEFITLFAYYREKHQSLPNFSRADLEKLYATSHTVPPRNYIRDFISAVKRGWIHEDGENSYITSKGIEAVESGFADGQKLARRTIPKISKSTKKAKTAKKTKKAKRHP